MHMVLLVMLFGVVVKERKRRQLAEQRIEVLEKTSMKLIQHYDSRFIELAKEVSCMELAARSHAWYILVVCDH